MPPKPDQNALARDFHGVCNERAKLAHTGLIQISRKRKNDLLFRAAIVFCQVQKDKPVAQGPVVAVVFVVAAIEDNIKSIVAAFVAVDIVAAAAAAAIFIIDNICCVAIFCNDILDYMI